MSDPRILLLPPGRVRSLSLKADSWVRGLRWSSDLSVFLSSVGPGLAFGLLLDPLPLFMLWGNRMDWVLALVWMLGVKFGASVSGSGHGWSGINTSSHSIGHRD